LQIRLAQEELGRRFGGHGFRENVTANPTNHPQLTQHKPQIYLRRWNRHGATCFCAGYGYRCWQR